MIKSLEYFRAIAIIFIVAGHTFSIAGLNLSTLLEFTIQNIIFGGTTLFVLISGFLFHHVFYKNYNFIGFLKKKIKVIVFPYIVFSLLPIIYYTFKNINSNIYFDTESLNYISLGLKYLFTGTGLFIYWYIPFIMLMFLLSPLHMKFIGIKPCTKIVLITVMLIISSLLHRSIHNYNVFHNLLYFMPVYLIGITASIHKEKIYNNLSGREFYILGLVVFFAFYQAYSGNIGSYHKLPFKYIGLDLMLFQKIFLGLFFMVWLHRFEETRSKLLEIVAATSFTIFFMHAFLLWIISSLKFSFNGNWFFYIVFVAIIIFICLVVALLVKKNLPKYSRYIIGF